MYATLAKNASWEEAYTHPKENKWYQDTQLLIG